MNPAARPLALCFFLIATGCGDDDGAPGGGTAAATEGTADDGADDGADDVDDGAATDTEADATTEPGADSTGSGDATTDPTADGSTGGGTGEAEDLDMTPEDFACLLDWPRVRRFRITNLLGHEDDAIAVAENPDGGVYPVGTVIQLIPNEAMVKRAQGWSAETSDWEFFSLSTSAAGTVIEDRGTTETINAFGGNCFDCHAKAEPQWDLVCEQDHGCDPIPIPEATIDMLQENDPRCR